MKIEQSVTNYPELEKHLKLLSADKKTGAVYTDYKRLLGKVLKMTAAEERNSGVRGAKRAIVSWWNYDCGKIRRKHDITMTCAGAILLQELINAIRSDKRIQ